MIPRTVVTNGIRMHLAEAGDGPPLVLLHGLGWDHELWRATIEKFSDRYRVIAGDTRGHGRSDKPPAPYSIQQFSDDWHGALDALAVKKACVLGFSQGGMVAQLLALQHPQDVAALMLVCTSCRSDPSVKEIMEERIRQAKTAGPEAAARLAAKGIFSKRFTESHPKAIEDFVRWRAAMDQDALISAIRAGYGFDVKDQLSAISVPTLAVYGEEDALTPAAILKQVADAIPGAQLKGIARTGHMIPVEQPQAFEAILGAFLDEHYPAKTKGRELR